VFPKQSFFLDSHEQLKYRNMNFRMLLGVVGYGHGHGPKEFLAMLDFLSRKVQHL